MSTSLPHDDVDKSPRKFEKRLLHLFFDIFSPHTMRFLVYISPMDHAGVDAGVGAGVGAGMGAGIGAGVDAVVGAGGGLVDRTHTDHVSTALCSLSETVH